MSKFNGKHAEYCAGILCDFIMDGKKAVHEDDVQDAWRNLIGYMEVLHALAVERNDVLEWVYSDAACYESVRMGEYALQSDLVDYYHNYTNDDGVLEPIDDLML